MSAINFHVQFGFGFDVI